MKTSMAHTECQFCEGVGTARHWGGGRVRILFERHRRKQKFLVRQIFFLGFSMGIRLSKEQTEARKEGKTGIILPEMMVVQERDTQRMFCLIEIAGLERFCSVMSRTVDTPNLDRKNEERAICL
jgi:hypothetical protein